MITDFNSKDRLDQQGFAEDLHKKTG